MKIIDLLNKIANGEKIEKFKYNEHIFEYDEHYKDWYDENDTILFDSCELADLNKEVEILEVEIIEEEKKIPEKLTVQDLLDLDTGSLLKRIVDNQNEIIDYLKSKGDE